jgi:rhamnosyltransferase
MTSTLKRYQKGLVAIVVTFNPDINRLNLLIKATLPQVSSINLVDNQSKNKTLIKNLIQGQSRVNFIPLDHNYGIAYAMNRGIEAAIDIHASFVLLLDQDSRPMYRMTEYLRLGFYKSRDVIAVGPLISDERSQGFTIVRDENTNTNTNSPYIETDFLISSGTMIDANKLILVGGFKSHYFIDHVDTEWVFRALKRGYRAIVSNNALLDHELGDRVVVLNFGFRKYIVYYHSPLRDYYMFRNTILLAKDSVCPLFWRWLLLLRIPKFILYFLCFGEKKYLRFRLMMKGIWHGLSGISGKYDMKKNKCIPIPVTSLDI